MTPSPGEALIDHAEVTVRAKEYVAAYSDNGGGGILSNYPRDGIEDGFDFARAYLALAAKVHELEEENLLLQRVALEGP